MTKLLFKEETYKVIGACITVHKKLGSGFLESVYQEALAKELSKAKIPFKQQEKLNIYYDNEILKKYFMADFVCYDKIIVEIKATYFLTEKMNQQVINYLKSTNFEVRLLLNFGEKSLKWKRFINTLPK
jgi:GxxExxY protein